MGFLDKLKQVGHAITGGGAEVTVTMPEHVAVGSTFKATITAVVDDQPLAIRGVYLLVRADEELQIDPANVEIGQRDIADLSTDGWEETELADPTHKEFGSEQTVDLRVDTTGEQELAAGSRHVWTLTVALPADAKPTCTDERHRHVWHIRAGLDALGNDPDSDWIEFTVE
jgi:hypothetical protein